MEKFVDCKGFNWISGGHNEIRFASNLGNSLSACDQLVQGVVVVLTKETCMDEQGLITKLLQIADLKHFHKAFRPEPLDHVPELLLPCRLGAVSLLLWLSTNPDPWRLAGTEGGREVGVWGGGSHDVRVHNLHPPRC